MSIEQFDVVDIIGINPAGAVVLTISDHLDWSNEAEHLLTLQEKLNRYLAFVESGEILERFPDGKDREIVFQIVFKFKPTKEARLFLQRAYSIVQGAGFLLQHEVFAESYDN